MSMFCYQCQEAAKGVGCTIKGVCGKDEDVSNLQDLLIYSLKGLSIVALRANENKIDLKDCYKIVIDGLFTTITNANFDKQAILRKIKATLKLRDDLKQLVEKDNQIPENLFSAVYWIPEKDEYFFQKANLVGILNLKNEDIRSLQELIIYGLKGIAAYAEHASNLGYHDEAINLFMIEALAVVSDTQDIQKLMEYVLKTGEYGVKVMALLDNANTSTFGNPEISTVNLGTRNNPGILISGHDLKDLEELLKQTENTGVDVYTHCEMLPAHYYPAFKKYKHFAGNYGNAWWKQREEFESFNGPILFTTNCIVPPSKNASYKDRIYTTGSAGLEGSIHIDTRTEGGEKDFTVIIEHAKKCAVPKAIENGEIIGGFAHHQVDKLAGKIVDAIKAGAIKRFFVMAGCDGRMKERNYYTDFAQQLPNDTVILTSGCAKYRYNKLKLGDIGGIPRVLDAGQCNDSYSLVVTALKLKEAFGFEDINQLPVSYNIAWYEQKAVIVLLALLFLGVKNIHLGPTLPAFLSPNVIKVLVENFQISGINSVTEDIENFMGLEVEKS